MIDKIEKYKRMNRRKRLIVKYLSKLEKEIISDNTKDSFLDEKGKEYTHEDIQLIYFSAKGSTNELITKNMAYFWFFDDKGNEYYFSSQHNEEVYKNMESIKRQK